MNGDGFGVGASLLSNPWRRPLNIIAAPHRSGWYDSKYDEELGNQPCIFTSVTPVRALDAPSCLQRGRSMLTGNDPVGLEQHQPCPLSRED